MIDKYRSKLNLSNPKKKLKINNNCDKIIRPVSK